MRANAYSLAGKNKQDENKLIFEDRLRFLTENESSKKEQLLVGIE
jgi:hypothetical protein